jgi:hypothetical protein
MVAARVDADGQQRRLGRGYSDAGHPGGDSADSGQRRLKLAAFEVGAEGLLLAYEPTDTAQDPVTQWPRTGWRRLTAYRFIGDKRTPPWA